jgi:hypothetical protein
MSTAPAPPRKRVALVCTNFTMQSAFGLLIIAINSVRLGFETMIYFTFEGLHMIRPGHLAQLRYYPTGVDPSEAEVDRYTTDLRDKMERKDIPFHRRCGDHAGRRLHEAGNGLGSTPDILSCDTPDTEPSRSNRMPTALRARRTRAAR